jgi:predicted NUDIX family phosphoesterase
MVDRSLDQKPKDREVEMEKVWGVPVKYLASYVPLNSGVLILDREKFLSPLLEKAEFRDREPAELDSNFKQLIPYIVFRDRSGRYLTYERLKGAEKRLSGKRSLGIGGHINPNDAEGTDFKSEVLLNAAEREIREELSFQASCLDMTEDLLYRTYLQLVYDDSTTVGQVHLGIIFTVFTNLGKLSAGPDGEIGNLKVLTKQEILDTLGYYENWSKAVVLHEDPKDIKQILDSQAPVEITVNTALDELDGDLSLNQS